MCDVCVFVFVIFFGMLCVVVGCFVLFDVCVCVNDDLGDVYVWLSEDEGDVSDDG